MKDAFILLVEDNPDDADLTTRALVKSNVMNRVVIARDGAEALDVVHQQGLRPQLVLLDLKLPKIDGLEVLRRIRNDERTKHLPVVVLTSSKEDRDIVESYNLGANSYVQKPVDFAQFMSAVGQLGLYWLVLNESPARS